MHRSDASEPLTPLGWAVQVLGWLALFASLALLSPGIVTEANAEPAASHAHEHAVGESCQAGDAPERVATHVEHMLQVLEAEALAQADAARAAGVAPDEPVVLDGRGYNYRNAPRFEPEAAPAE